MQNTNKRKERIRRATWSYSEPSVKVRGQVNKYLEILRDGAGSIAILLFLGSVITKKKFSKDF